MKSTFAKIVDCTVGAALLFFSVTAILRYYLPLYAAAMTSSAVTVGVYLLASARSKKHSGEEKLSRAADRMFYDFMFLNAKAPANALKIGLEAKGVRSVVRGDALYCGKTAAFFFMDAAPDEKALARAVSRAAHFGADKVVAFCKTAGATLDVDNVTVQCVYGDDVYKLYASLGALPKNKFDKSHRGTRRFLGALDGDKAVRYLLLSASLFTVAYFTGFPIVATACAGISAALFAATLTYNAAKHIIRRKEH